MSCGCDETTPCVSLCSDSDTGCPIQLDFGCVIYHKDNSEISNLTELGLSNGATLTLFAETVSSKIGQVDIPSFILPCLRADYTVNTLKQFAEAVDTRLCELTTLLDDATAASQTPVAKTDSDTVAITLSGTYNHTIRADVKISATSDNLADALADGIYVAPQILSVNYTTKELTISEGNTVDLNSFMCGVGGFLGNTTSDPAGAVDGQYWYDTGASELRIKLNGVIKVITTT